ncbi:MAG: thiolase family protein, partial [Flavobacteriales bacterium]|nr:thiolase family protein [Flavobacteriales bacterium]
FYREEQDEFAMKSHQKAAAAIESGRFKDEIVPWTVKSIFLDENQKRQEKDLNFDTDEGVRANTNMEALARLRPVFQQGGTVTAGNSSQTSDGAAFVMVMSEEMVKELNLQPIARLVSYDVAALEPRVMGVGPIYAVPKALKRAGMTIDQIDLVELNEAFASQSVACMRELGLNPDIVNVNGGAIAIGHPLGCTGAKLSVQMFNELKKRDKKYGMVTMCVGTGQGAAGIFERLN